MTRKARAGRAGYLPSPREDGHGSRARARHRSRHRPAHRPPPSSPVRLRSPGPRNLMPALAGRKQHHDPLGLEPPCREHERVRRCLVEPVRIVDQVEQRLRSAASERRPSVASEIRKRSSPPFRQAERHAAPLRCGRSVSDHGSDDLRKAAKEGAPPTRRRYCEDTHPSACGRVSSSADLPTPASPRITNTALREARAPSSNPPMRERSGSLP